MLYNLTLRWFFPKKTHRFQSENISNSKKDMVYSFRYPKIYAASIYRNPIPISIKYANLCQIPKSVVI